jgi:hypothetical protein
LYLAVFFVLGLPTGNGRSRRPRLLSNLLRKLSLPKGLPVCVLPLEHFKIHLTIIVHKEHILTVIPTLGNMMRKTHYDCPR